MLSFVRSLREADFALGLYVQELQGLLPWLFALDRTNYSRWFSMHIRDILWHWRRFITQFCRNLFPCVLLFKIIQKILGSMYAKFHASILNEKLLVTFCVIFFVFFMIKHKIYKNTKIALLHIYFCFYGSWQYICQISCFSVELELSNEFFRVLCLVFL